MAGDPRLLSQAIHDLLYEALTTAPAGSSPVMDAASTVLSLSVPGLPLDPADFANPWTPLNPGGNPTTAESFAWLVDDVPTLSSVYTPNGQSLETLYGQIVQANTPAAPAAPLAPPPRPETVRPAAFQRFLDVQAAREDAVLGYMSRRLQVDPNDPAQQQRWEASAPALQARLRATAQAERESVATLSTLLPNEGDGQNDSVAARFATARLNFQLSTLGSALGPGFSWHMTLAQPQNWFAPEATFFEVDLQTRRTSSGQTPPRFGRSPGLLTADTGAWAFRTQERLLRRPVARESLDLRVRFKFLRVGIRRPWLDASLLSLGGWALAGRRRLSLSTGSLTDNPGLLPLLPTALIVARDLQISAAWSQSDITFIRERLQQKDLAFGPFALSGRYQRPRARTTTALQARFDGVNLTAPDLQVIGHVGQLIPACPPLDG